MNSDKKDTYAEGQSSIIHQEFHPFSISDKEILSILCIPSKL